MLFIVPRGNSVCMHTTVDNIQCIHRVTTFTIRPWENNKPAQAIKLRYHPSIEKLTKLFFHHLNTEKLIRLYFLQSQVLQSNFLGRCHNYENLFTECTDDSRWLVWFVAQRNKLFINCGPNALTNVPGILLWWSTRGWN